MGVKKLCKYKFRGRTCETIFEGFVCPTCKSGSSYHYRIWTCQCGEEFDNPEKFNYHHGNCLKRDGGVTSKTTDPPTTDPTLTTTLYSPMQCEVTGLRDSNIQPTYYKGRMVMDIINEFDLSFCCGNVLTYLLRHARKNGVEDLKKAKWYLEEEIRILEEVREEYEKLLKVGGG